MNTVRSTRAQRALVILTLDAIREAAAAAEVVMREASEAAWQADSRAKAAEELANAAPTKAFCAAAEAARRAADTAEAAAQSVYKRLGGVVHRRDVAERELARLDQIRAETARWTEWVSRQRELADAQDAHLWT